MTHKEPTFLITTAQLDRLYTPCEECDGSCSAKLCPVEIIKQVLTRPAPEQDEVLVVLKQIRSMMLERLRDRDESWSASYMAILRLMNAKINEFCPEESKKNQAKPGKS